MPQTISIPPILGNCERAFRAIIRPPCQEYAWQLHDRFTEEAKKKNGALWNRRLDRLNRAEFLKDHWEELDLEVAVFSVIRLTDSRLDEVSSRPSSLKNRVGELMALAECMKAILEAKFHVPEGHPPLITRVVMESCLGQAKKLLTAHNRRQGSETTAPSASADCVAAPAH